MASRLEDHPKPPSFVPRRMVVVMANEMAGERLLLAFEDREGVVLSSSHDPRLHLPGGNLGTILVAVEPARSDRILLRGAPEGDAPVVGAAYRLEPARDRIRVTHHPFAFDGVERTITLD